MKTEIFKKGTSWVWIVRDRRGTILRRGREKTKPKAEYASFEYKVKIWDRMRY